MIKTTAVFAVLALCMSADINAQDTNLRLVKEGQSIIPIDCEGNKAEVTTGMIVVREGQNKITVDYAHNISDELTADSVTPCEKAYEQYDPSEDHDACFGSECNAPDSFQCSYDEGEGTILRMTQYRYKIRKDGYVWITCVYHGLPLRTYPNGPEVPCAGQCHGKTPPTI